MSAFLNNNNNNNNNNHYYYFLLLTATEFSLGGSNPYSSTDKVNKNKYT